MSHKSYSNTTNAQKQKQSLMYRGKLSNIPDITKLRFDKHPGEPKKNGNKKITKQGKRTPNK